jgi:uncharacterized membrane protein SpoIIM required for sporulation
MARRPARLSPPELEELIQLYQQASSDLAYSSVTYPDDTALVTHLTVLVGEAHGSLYAERGTDAGGAARRFVTRTFPLAMWHIRRFIAVAALCMLVPWAIFNVWLAVSPEAFDVSMPEAAREAYLQQDFEAYYSSGPAEDFATQVFTNNVRVALLAFAAGVLVCVVTVLILAYNGANGGVAGGLFTHIGEWEKFWGLILPHGLLELSAVVVAGAAGLRIGWTVIDPDDRPRLSAVSEEARTAGAVLIGLVPAFAIAGFIEAFVTGRPWSTTLRVGIGVLAFAAYWSYVFVFATVARRTAQPRD